MHSGGKTLKILDVLLLFSFFVYAISPLTYTARGNKSENEGPGNIQSHGVSLYLFDLLLSQVILQNEEDPEAQETTPDSNLLLKKKRAVLSSKNLKTLMFVQLLEALSHDVIFPAHSAAFARTVQQDQSNFYAHYVLPLHSGNSPPSV